MHPIEACQSYAARPAGRAVYEHGPHAFKVYYVDIVGRTRPERYEWDRAGLDRDAVMETVREVMLARLAPPVDAGALPPVAEAM